MVVYLVFALAIVLTIVSFVQSWRDGQENQQLPVVQAPARVVTTYSGHRGSVFGTSPGREMVRYAVFELKTGERRNFEIGSVQVSEGATGTLTYQGKQFLGFHYP
jgi:Protein of unknown function (DUF2500)